MENSKVDNRLLRAVLILIGVFLIIVVLSGLCTNRMSKPVNKVIYYRVNKSTGLYRSYEIDSEMIEILAVGDELRIPGGKVYPECVTYEDPVVSTMELCRLYSPKHNRYGWVLLKWLDRMSE